MDATQNSKLPLVERPQYNSQYHSYSSSFTPFPQNPQTHFTNFYPLFSTMKFNELKNERENRGNAFTPYEEASCYDVGESCCAKSDTDSCSEVGDYASDDDEVSVDELLLNDAKSKKKIEVLAEMVGVDSTEPEMVLTEVVRVLKQLKRMNQY